MIDIVRNIGSLNRQAWNVRWTDPDQSLHLTTEVQSLLAREAHQISAGDHALNTAMAGRTGAWLSQDGELSATISNCTQLLAVDPAINEPRVRVDLLSILSLAQYQAGNTPQSLNNIRIALEAFEFRSDSYACLHLLAAGLPPQSLNTIFRQQLRSPDPGANKRLDYPPEAESDVTMLSRMIPISRENHDQCTESCLQFLLGFAHLESQSIVEAKRCTEAGLNLAHENNSQKLEVFGLYCMTAMDLANSEFEVAEKRGLEVRAKANDLGYELLAVRCDELLGRINFQQKRLDAALTNITLALENAKRLQYALLEKRCYDELAQLMEAKGDFKLALHFLRKCHQAPIDSSNAENSIAGGEISGELQYESGVNHAVDSELPTFTNIERPEKLLSDGASDELADTFFRDYFHSIDYPMVVLAHKGEWRIIAVNKVARKMFGLKNDSRISVRPGKYIQRGSLRSIASAFESSLVMAKKNQDSHYSFVLQDETLKTSRNKSISSNLAVNIIKIGKAFSAVVSFQRSGSSSARVPPMQPDNNNFLNVDRRNAEFLDSFNHEVRSLLTIIFGEAQLLRRDSIEGRSMLSNSQVTQVEQLIENTRYLQTYISELIDLSKTGANQDQKLVLDRVNVRELIDRTIAECRNDIVRKDLRLESQIDDSTPDLIALNAAKVRRVLQIILRNYARLTNTGTIFVAVAVEDRWWQCTVFNPQCAVSAGQVKLMAALLSGASTANSNMDDHSLESEASLGLRLSQRLATLMGGNLGVEYPQFQAGESAIELPLRIVLRLPLGSDALAGEAIAAQAVEAVSQRDYN